MKNAILMALLLFAGTGALAQDNGEPPVEPATTVIKLNINRLYGKVVDAKSGKGIEALSVQLFALKGSNVAQDSLVGGMLSRANGDFSFSNLPRTDSFRLVVSSVGYKPVEQLVVLSPATDNSVASLQKDLGNIAVEPDVQILGGVTVVAQRPAMEMGVDRRIFNVDRNITATGGTAIDVMKNIPSVTVDVDGNVQLRNTAPQIFVDGRPTILTLDQIPAENIEKVELITNPSAKFDAASTGGIINVVLKRNKRVGLNGIVSAGVGYPGIYNSNLNLNARQGKFNFFVSGSLNASGGKSNGETLRQNKENGVIENYFNQYSEGERKRRFASLRFGLDYFLDNRNTISITQGLVKGRFSNNETQDQEYLSNIGVLERIGERFSDGASQFNRYNTQLNYTHKFPTDGKELTANINYNYGNGENTSNILNSFYYPDGSEYSSPVRVRNDGGNNNDQVTFQVDFVNPFSEKAKLETGARSFINDFSSTFSAFAQNNGAETKLPLSNNIAYREVVNAFYITYSNSWKSIRYQAGLRAEHSKFDGQLLDSAKAFGYTLPGSFKDIFDGLFPSLFLTKSLSEKAEVQLNYSRRVRRPNFWQLNPFFDINDPVNISRGNPQLRPEYTNSLEFNYNQQYKGGNFLGVLYYRNNQGDITRYSDTISTAQFQQLNNAAVDPNAILNTFVNIQATNRMGAEFTIQQKLSKNFDVTPSVNLQYRKVIGSVGKLDLSNEGFNWEAKLIANYKIETENPSFWNNMSFQVIGEYESPEVVPQGRRLEQYSADFAFKKEFLKNKKAAFTFSVNDIFRTNRWGSIYDTDQFYQNSFRRNVRTFRINLSYKFGDSDFSLFKRPDNRDDDND